MLSYRFLLLHGVDINARSVQGEERGNNALHEACAGGDLSITQLLYHSGTPYCSNEHGMTPAIIAASEGMFQPMEFFLSIGACYGDEAVNALELAGSAAVMRGHLLCSPQQMGESAPYFKRAFELLKGRCKNININSVNRNTRGPSKCVCINRSHLHAFV